MIPIQLKRSSVAGRIPATTDFLAGELGVNTTDGKLFFKKTVSGVDSIVTLQELTAGNGVIITNGAVSIGNSVVTLTGTQTLTNKTLTTPIISSSGGQWVFNADGTLSMPVNGDIVNQYGISVLGGTSSGGSGGTGDYDGGYPNTIYGGMTIYDFGGI